MCQLQLMSATFKCDLYWMKCNMLLGSLKRCNLMNWFIVYVIICGCISLPDKPLLPQYGMLINITAAICVGVCVVLV
jgi:hypothetical protein